jgi:hypothetical protein
LKIEKLGASLTAWIFLIPALFGQPAGGGIPAKSAEKIVPLNEIIDAYIVRVGHGRVFVVDREDLAVYSLDDFRFLGRIGRKGQGPGEFEMLQDLDILPDGLLVRSMNKIHYFSKDGVFERAVVIPSQRYGGYPVPFGNRFVWFYGDFQEDGSLGPPKGHLCDENLNPIKDVFGEAPGSPPPPPPPIPGAGSPGKKRDVPMIFDFFSYRTEDDKIFIADSRQGLSISVFNNKGDFLYEIRHEVNRVKVPAGYKDDILKKQPPTARYWASFNPVVPQFFPIFFGFKIDGGKIYAIATEQKDNFHEIIVMDLAGKILRRSYGFPLAPNWFAIASTNLRFDIHQDKIFYLEYNDAAERFELHIVPIL